MKKGPKQQQQLNIVVAVVAVVVESLPAQLRLERRTSLEDVEAFAGGKQRRGSREESRSAVEVEAEAGKGENSEGGRTQGHESPEHRGWQEFRCWQDKK